MHYCPKHWPYKPRSQRVAASDDAITIGPECVSHDASHHECLTVVCPDLRTDRSDASSRVLMLCEDDESDESNTEHEMSDDASWREIPDDTDDIHINAAPHDFFPTHC